MSDSNKSGNNLNNNSGNKFQFTRHIQSCNNAESGEQTSFGRKNLEPSVSIYGIQKAVEFAYKNRDRYKFDNSNNTIYVSNLLRTWITAVILYNNNFSTNSNNKTLTLYISPYLKEKTKKILGHEFIRGNYPEDLQKTISRFIEFLNLYKDKGIYTPNNKNKPKYINMPEVIILKIPEYNEGDNKNKINNNWQEIKINSLNKFKLNNINNIKDTVGPKTTFKEEYLKVGDLKKFMNWYNTLPPNSNTKIPKSNTKIHVITHSGVMRNYVKVLVNKINNERIINSNPIFTKTTAPSSIFIGEEKLLYDVLSDKLKNKYNNMVNIDLDEISKDLGEEYYIYKVRNSNSWSMVTNYNQETIPKLLEGMYNDDKEGSILEKNEQCDSLCGLYKNKKKCDKTPISPNKLKNFNQVHNSSRFGIGSINNLDKNLQENLNKYRNPIQSVVI